jgi:hypothetical protein
MDWRDKPEGFSANDTGNPDHCHSCVGNYYYKNMMDIGIEKITFSLKNMIQI